MKRSSTDSIAENDVVVLIVIATTTFDAHDIVEVNTIITAVILSLLVVIEFSVGFESIFESELKFELELELEIQLDF